MTLTDHKTNKLLDLHQCLHGHGHVRIYELSSPILEWDRMKGSLFPIATLLVTLGAPAIAWAQQQAGPYSGPYMWHGGPWMFIGPLMMIVFIAVAVAAVVLIVRWSGGSSHATAPHPSPGKTPLDILKERFARGEIDKEEFEESRRVLEE